MQVRIYNGFKKYYRIYNCTCGHATKRWADGNWPNCCTIQHSRELKSEIGKKKIRKVIWQKIEDPSLF